MTDEEILLLANGTFTTAGSSAEFIEFARAIESRTLTNQKAKWYQEWVEAGLRQELDQLPYTTKMMGLIASEWAGLDEPSKRQWVDLPADTLTQIMTNHGNDWKRYTQAVNDELKELNT